MKSEPASAGTLVAADREGRYGLSIPLRVDAVERTPDNPAWGQLLHCSDVNDVHVKVTIFDGEELADYPFEEGCWYEFDDVNPDVYQGSVGIIAKWARQVSELRDRPYSPPERPQSVRRLGDLDAIAALDIETIATVNEHEREATNPRHQEVLCVGLGHRGSSEDAPESTVLFRDDATSDAEVHLIERTIDWLERRDWDALVTFSGAWFDLPVLVGRADLAGKAVGDRDLGRRVRETLESCYHADLSATKNRSIGAGSLEDMAAYVGSLTPETRWTDYDIEQSPRSWRPDQWAAMRSEGRDPPSDDPADPVVYNSDVPYFGQAWLEAMDDGRVEEADRLFECLDAYTRADIDPLFAIADSEAAAGQPAFFMEY